jgi:hypothetical protein
VNDSSWITRFKMIVMIDILFVGFVATPYFTKTVSLKSEECIVRRKVD